ncbi:ABC transporter ATP-binding protein [Kangiella koreensis]|uniref:ABC transporter related n=1 Tax=Kangiella koreensis (strain DSM 16069 / JCM 12317 / KCTC 12182 / SW-125) TaxID=523791 RepID=C7RD51_KANKD|nr:ABC transporter ATP-binding protein [Kangiella koreensis]ACV27193.1 ABC transporter related [Kangiella koreensis DSM 16069]
MIEVRGISKRYGDLQAVDNLSITIEKGHIFGLLGPNGAGKSTTISMMCGLISPDMGTVQLNGEKPTDKATKHKIGLIPQSIALYEELSALDNLSFFADLYGLSAKTKIERMEWSLQFVGLQDRAKDTVSEYSGGMKRRLNLAASLLHDPDFIFMDEPTAGVDPQSRNKLFESVLELKDLGKTIIYTTHYMEEAEKLCDRVGVVDKGQLLALGTVDELIEQHGGHSSVNIRSEHGDESFMTANPVNDLMERLKGMNTVENLSLRRPNLETVFLNLTGKQLRD